MGLDGDELEGLPHSTSIICRHNPLQGWPADSQVNRVKRGSLSRERQECGLIHSMSLNVAVWVAVRFVPSAVHADKVGVNLVDAQVAACHLAQQMCHLHCVLQQSCTT